MVKRFKSISRETKEMWEKIAKDYFNHRKFGTSSKELIEIPAMKALIGDVSGLTVLDAGCGYGLYDIWAKKQGAKEVVGVDISEKMLEIAKERAKRENVGINFIRSDLDNLSRFKKEYFDLIICSIVVGYFGDLVKYFSEFARILKKRGIFVFSQVHPMRTAGQFKRIGGRKALAVTDYMPAHFAKEEGKWKNEEGKLVPIYYYHYPLSDFSQALKESSFLIEEIVEPKPIEKMKKILPEKYERFSRIPLFILIKARKL